MSAINNNSQLTPAAAIGLSILGAAGLTALVLGVLATSMP